MYYGILSLNIPPYSTPVIQLHLRVQPADLMRMRDIKLAIVTHSNYSNNPIHMRNR